MPNQKMKIKLKNSKKSHFDFFDLLINKKQKQGKKWHTMGFQPAPLCFWAPYYTINWANWIIRKEKLLKVIKRELGKIWGMTTSLI